ncbi:MAG: hypothetical protein RL199_1717 [Pseudomonadota bacterium]|jgi:hypothetical protein
MALHVVSPGEPAQQGGGSVVQSSGCAAWQRLTRSRRFDGPALSPARGPATTARFERLSSFESLLEASRRAFRGTRGTDALRFIANREVEVVRLMDELRSGSYRPQPYRTFRITDPKPRTISAAPFRDRVVHHALCDEIEGDLERGALPSSYACRKGKGTLAALWAAASLVRRRRYVLQLDVEHYFETVPHDRRAMRLRTRLVDGPVAGLAELFVRAGAPGSESGFGLPIGNLSSQYFANFYLDSLDRFIVRGLGATGHVRYMDDLLVFDDDRDRLWGLLAEVEAFVRERLGLRLKARATRVGPVVEGVSFLGWRVFPGTIRLDGPRRRRFLRRWREALRALEGGGLGMNDVAASMNSVVAWSRWGHTGGLRRSLFAKSGHRGG